MSRHQDTADPDSNTDLKDHSIVSNSGILFDLNNGVQTPVTLNQLVDNKTLPENDSKTVLPADVEVTEQRFSVILQPVQKEDLPPVPNLDPPTEIKTEIEMEETSVDEVMEQSFPVILQPVQEVDPPSLSNLDPPIKLENNEVKIEETSVVDEVQSATPMSEEHEEQRVEESLPAESSNHCGTEIRETNGPPVKEKQKISRKTRTSLIRDHSYTKNHKSHNRVKPGKRNRNRDAGVKKMRLDKDLEGSSEEGEKGCSDQDEEIQQEEQNEDMDVQEVSDSDESGCSDVWPLLSKGCEKSSWEVLSETSIARDRNHPEIYVTRIQKNTFTTDGKMKKSNRVYNSKHPCPFCYQFQTNFSHHVLSKKHAKEREVQEILKHEANSIERKRLMNILRLKGEHQHNLEVIEKKAGEFLLGRRNTNGDFDYEEYTPCPNCYEWIKPSNLKRHQPHCPAKREFNVSKGCLFIQSEIITGKIPKTASQSLVKEVFPIMLDDEIGKLARIDPLVINLGNQCMQRNRDNRTMAKYYTSSIMRRATKLLMNARESLNDASLDMDCLLQPKYFDTIVKAALLCSKPDDFDEENLQAPSTALKLGFDIKRMTSAKLSYALMKNDQLKMEESKSILTLMKIEWGQRVTQLAKTLLQERTFNRHTELPLPEDIKKLAAYMKKELGTLDLKDRSYENYRRVARLVLARLTLYNRRRCHEMQALRLYSYYSRKKGIDGVAVQLIGDMTSFEKELVKRQELHVVEIRGKMGLGVPVLLPKDVCKPMIFLANKHVREEAGILECNPYLFANSQAGVFRAYDSIRSISELAGLSNTHLIKTINMRKYMATMLQCLDTTENVQQWIVDHLGHTMNINKQHFCQTSDISDRVEVAKLLLIHDLNMVHRFKGKQLKDIQINDIVGIDEFSKDKHSPSPPFPLPSPETEVDIPDLNCFSEDEDDSDSEIQSKEALRTSCSLRRKWSKEEEKELRSLFSECFAEYRCPKRREVETQMKMSERKNGLIHKRPRDNIKKKISQMLVKKRIENIELIL
ncbi:uncharacterized protein LOC134236011 [Saccostrea cucullata]|uniref:uncharacterized protein LOC134236011 n=1 Tax=Saccostrea cuccullata TaxID=36930 RepID=UPI002ED2C58D